MRKFLALVLSLIICCSLYAFNAGVANAVEGAFSGVVSTLISQAIEPKVSLQGVTVSYSPAEGIGSISFVRSDVATYRSSLLFFADSGRSDLIAEIWEQISADVSWCDDISFDDTEEGDVILDGIVRFKLYPTWAEASISLLVTGRSIGENVVIEGTFSIAVENSVITIESEGISINDTESIYGSVDFILPDFGGLDG